jgi:hypothetical protein
MKIKMYLLLGLLYIPFTAPAQYSPELYYTDDQVLSADEEVQTRSSRAGSAESFYNDLNTWIPRLSPSDPIRNPPIMYIEISFHIFLDDNGGNSKLTDTPEGHARIDSLFNSINQTYSYYGNPSDPVAGVIELPNRDTRIRFALGDNKERIYFYNNTEWNKKGEKASLSGYDQYIRTHYPERSNKLNIYFTSGLKGANVNESNIIIDNAGQAILLHQALLLILPELPVMQS